MAQAIVELAADDDYDRGLLTIRAVVQAVSRAVTHPELPTGLLMLGASLADLIQAEAVEFCPHGSAGARPELVPNQPRAGGSPVSVLWAAGDQVLGTVKAQFPRTSAGRERLDVWVLQLAAELTAPAWVRRLAELSPATGDRLSNREEEVARLVARGLTNERIGIRLHISPATVATHVRHILAKLGFRSRAQIAAWYAAGSGPR